MMRKESASTMFINSGAGSKAAFHKIQVPGGNIPVPADLANDDWTGQRGGFGLRVVTYNEIELEDAMHIDEISPTGLEAFIRFNFCIKR
jgi:hypothetical protein